MTSARASTAVDESRITLHALRRWNVGLGALHLAQAVVVIVLTNARSLPVTAAFGNGPPGQPRGPLQLERPFFSWLMETTSRPGRDVSWTPFVFSFANVLI